MKQWVIFQIKRRLFQMIPVRSWRKKLQKGLPPKWLVRKYSKKEIQLFNECLKRYPKILSATETLEFIVKNNVSFCRIGDGEFNYIVDKINVFNKKDESLKKRLHQICEEKNTDNCLICFNNYEQPNCETKISRWFLSHGVEVLPVLLKVVQFKEETFGDAYFLLKTMNTNLDLIKSLWNNKKILFVCNKESLVVSDSLKLFETVKEKDFLFVPSQNAFDRYETIFERIITYTTDWIIYLEVGATASVLSWDLSNLGYQAFDMGDFYKRYLMKADDEWL